MTRVLVVTLSLAFSSPLLAELPPLKLQPIYENVEITRPISVQVPNDGTGRRFLTEQTGKIKLLPEDETNGENMVFLDLTDSIQVDRDFEEGLLGLAFHPNFAETGTFYVTFSRQGPKRLVLAEYTVSADNPNQADPESERILLEVQQPEWNHNSGNLFFGPEDGLLYVCVGDGGLKNGVFMLSQKLTRWNGKVLRIDVDSRTASLPYGIPADNPFVNEPNACPEIYAYGLRNPWGAAIDPETGLFYLADVGQDLYEEINLIEKGGNYGWEIREATHKFLARDTMLAAIGKKGKAAEEVGFIEPIHEYTRSEGLSITGGYVYRGDAIPELAGHFLYGDWRFGNLWALYYCPEEGKVTENYHFEKPEDLKNPMVQPTGFYPDENGEALVLDWRGGIFRLVKAE
ncbi:MAG: PQQ-dependent sugar dehydrogenase [Verrucomicrobiota bacterium]